MPASPSSTGRGTHGIERDPYAHFAAPPGWLLTSAIRGYLANADFVRDAVLLEAACAGGGDHRGHGDGAGGDLRAEQSGRHPVVRFAS